VAILSLENVTRLFDHGRTQVGPVSFEVQAGELVALVGRSGCGKSTVLNCAAGLLRPSSGSVRFDDRDLTTLSDSQLASLRRRQFGFVFQDYTVLEPLSARENIELPARMSRTALDRPALTGLADRLGLGGTLDRLVGQLSGGQRQRVAVARAMANDTKVLFADEPTGALDPVTRDEVLAVIEQARQEGVEGVLAATHDTELAARADRVLVLSEGRIVEEFTTPGAGEVLAALQLTGSGA
jgi:putative ABC transport system ATP-binding protein